MNLYLKKRQMGELSRSDVASALGIDFKKYVEIERGERKMPSKLIDKFNEIVKGKKNISKIEHLERKQEVDEWINEMKEKVNGEPKLRQKMEEFNIENYNVLGKLIGYSNGTGISTMINSSRPVSYDLKNALYSFFQDELNIQSKNKKTSRKTRTNYDKKNCGRLANNELLKFYEETDFLGWMQENRVTTMEIAKAMNMSDSTLYYYLHKLINKPKELTLKGIKDFMDNFTRDDVIETKENNMTTKEAIINEYKQKQNDIIEQIAEQQNEIKKIQHEIDLRLMEIGRLKEKNSNIEEFINIINKIGD